MVFWKTKEWWIAVIVAIVPVVNLLLGTLLDTEVLIAIVLPIIGLILGADWAERAEAKRIAAAKKKK